MFGPADAGRHFDLRQLGSLTFHHRNASRMCPSVVSKSSFQIARFQEVVDEWFKNIVKGILAPSPVTKEVAKVCGAGIAVGTDKRRSHWHLIEGLIPDLFETVRLAHAWPYARIDEIEEKQPRDALRSESCERQHCCAAYIMAHHPNSLNRQFV